ncbi:DUF935 domain-containing protein [Thalassococcus sp. S3]|uniref:DUF935 domain-containing protein n=1 Tax=Thalassococcus sp. S3 TaxID=2017482 RepID=UPI0010243A70|nr:DUF935 domain-containing protein [Thalassococcus sp. S3]QBF31505.1 hypothetical protein CFI11_09790 [Thalassococcus sp. S3]
MARTAQLLDHLGRPVRRAELKSEVAMPTLTGIRSPISGYPGDGLDPPRLSQILRAADHGDPVQYLELAETIEERDLHYVGVLGTRRRSVTQIPITVKPGSDDPLDVEIAERVETWLERDELKMELFDILDAVGKSYSFTEIIWETSMGQWQPARLEYRDPRWFRFDRIDLKTPMMLDDYGQEAALPAFKFIYASMKSKSGLPLRGGLARTVFWAYLFKKFTERDWAIFTQTFAQPLRVGKWGPGASKEDKETLFKAVANIAGDCAAIIPESMAIDFIEAANLGTAHSNYKERADWLDQQVSKAVLGQTTTTDAISGGHAVSKEHRQVQKDIEDADAQALQAVLNRDLIRPWVDLEYGPRENYPRLIIKEPEPEDLAQLTSALPVLVKLNMRVSEQEIRSKYGLSEPDEGERYLGQPHAGDKPPNPPETPQEPPQEQVEPQARDEIGSGSKIEYRLNTHWRNSGVRVAEMSQSPSAGRSEPPSEIALLTAQLAERAQGQVGDMLGRIEAMLDAAGSMEEFREMLSTGLPDLSIAGLAEEMAQAMIAAEAAGRTLTEDEAGE